MTNDRRGAWLLRAAGFFAIVWAIARACVQSITQDEGDTYFWFASRPAKMIWHPFPNNHVLNTLLMWITTRVFGLSSLTVRLPALLGAALYISTCYFLCRHLSYRISLQFPIFICLIYNPFVFDFLVAARGYSLANAFLFAAIAIPVWDHVKGAPSVARCCRLASLALALSFAASFSFVFVDAAALLVILGWALWRRGAESGVRIAGSLVLPGFLITLALCGYPLAHWPKGELLYGAHSLREMTRSLIDASFYRLNPQYLLIELYDTMDFIRPMLLPLLGILCVCQIALMRFDSWLGKLAVALFSVTALSVALSWLAFHFYRVPLPMTRTGLFLIPLFTLMVGVIAAAPARSPVAKWVRQGLTGVFFGLACYFVVCLRLSYFKEYQEGADAKDVYAVLARLNHTYGVTDTAIDGWYVAPLNFYRVLSKKETFPEFVYVPLNGLPTGQSIYVLHAGYYKPFLAKEGLAVIYRGKLSDVVVAVHPGGKIPVTAVAP